MFWLITYFLIGITITVGIYYKNRKKLGSTDSGDITKIVLLIIIFWPFMLMGIFSKN